MQSMQMPGFRLVTQNLNGMTTVMVFRHLCSDPDQNTVCLGVSQPQNSQHVLCCSLPHRQTGYVLSSPVKHYF